MNQLLNLFSTPVYLELIDKNEFLNSKQDILQFITDNPYKFINKCIYYNVIQKVILEVIFFKILKVKN